MADGRHLENRHKSAADGPVQNGMSMIMQRSKSTPEVEFQYGGRLSSERGSSDISAQD